MKYAPQYKKLVLAIIIVLLLCSLSFAGWITKWFSFDRSDALKEWKEKIFKGKVLYEVKIDKADGYLSAYSQNAASGILYKIIFRPKEQPLVSWKWKVITFPQKRKDTGAKHGWIERDDYAARFYVIFPAFIFINTKSLEYVWDRNIPEGTIMTSPYFKNIKIIVAESGEKDLGTWIYEKRNIYEDFKKAFGRKPPGVGAVAIMTDTDNTTSTAEANYDEIKVGYKDGED